jgi:hypothetical protein
MPGFAFLAMLLAVTSLAAEHLKPTHHIDVTVPAIYGTENAGPYGIKYLAPDKLAVWFTDNTSGQLSKRERLQPTDPWRMKMQVFDTTTGAAREFEWPTRKISTGIQVQADGTIVLLNGPLVRCLSPDMRQTGSVNLPELTKHRNERMLASSPGGQSVWAFESAETVGAARIDTRICKLTADLSIAADITSITANDNLIAATDSTHIGVRSIDTDWKALYRADPCCVVAAYFANQSTVIAYRDIHNSDTGQSNRSLLFFDTQGKLLREQPLDPGHEPGPIVSSSTGRYVLVTTPKPDFSTELLEYRLLSAKYRVWVYDLSTLKRIAEFDVSRNDARLFAFSLSPDARQVAVLAGSKISIYDIPSHP